MKDKQSHTSITELKQIIEQQSQEIILLRNWINYIKENLPQIIYDNTTTAIQHALGKYNIHPVEGLPSEHHIETVVLRFNEYVNPSQTIRDKLRSYFREMIMEKKLFVKDMGPVVIRHGSLAQFIRHLVECMDPDKLRALRAKKNTPKITLLSKFISQRIMIRHYNCDKPIPARNLDSPIRRAIQ